MFLFLTERRELQTEGVYFQIFPPSAATKALIFIALVLLVYQVLYSEVDFVL